MDQVLLQFNCPAFKNSINPFRNNMMFQQFTHKTKTPSNKYYNSKNCVFAVAVHNRDEQTD